MHQLNQLYLYLKLLRATKSAFSFEAIDPTLPPLNPNQPIHNKNAPKVTSGIFEAGITLTEPFLPYLFFLAPMNKNCS